MHLNVIEFQVPSPGGEAPEKNSEPENKKIENSPDNNQNSKPNSIQPIEAEPIKKTNEKEIKVNHDFKKVRPYIFQLITHGIILFISIYAYQDYYTAEEIYDEFAAKLQHKLIIDIETAAYDTGCPTDYEIYGTTTIPEPKSGCRCDLGIYQSSVCQKILANINLNTSLLFEARKQNLTEECKLQNANINTKTKKPTDGASNQPSNKMRDMINIKFDGNL